MPMFLGLVWYLNDINFVFVQILYQGRDNIYACIKFLITWYDYTNLIIWINKLHGTTAK